MSSSARKMLDECVRFESSIAPYVDGELDAGHAVDMEQPEQLARLVRAHVSD